VTPGLNLRALAKEREARQANTSPVARDDSSSGRVPITSLSSSGSGSISRSSTIGVNNQTAAPGTISKAALFRAHRSVRLARSLGLLLVSLATLGALLFGLRFAALVLAAAGFHLARAGGAWLHGMLPPMLQEGSGAPSATDLASASRCGLFSHEALAAPAACLGLELDVAVENLAFTCTYGKRNCLTNQMYSGELSLGKVLRLVWGKVSEGTMRCH